MTRARGIWCCLTVLALGCGPIPIAKVTLAVRQPVDQPLLEDATLIDARVFIDGKNLGASAAELDELEITIVLPLADEDEAATGHRLNVELATSREDSRGLARSRAFNLPLIRDVRAGKAEVAALTVPLLLSVPNAVTRFFAVQPNAREGAAVCAGPDGAVYFFGGRAGGTPVQNGYRLDPNNFEASDPIALGITGATSCAVAADGRVFIITPNGLFSSSGTATPEVVCSEAIVTAGLNRSVVIADDILWIVGESRVQFFENGSCSDAPSTFVPEPGYRAAAAPGGRLFLAVPAFVECGTDTPGWLVLDKERGPTVDFGCEPIHGVGDSFVVNGAASAPRASRVTADGDDIELEPGDAFPVNITGATILSGATGVDGKRAILIDESSATRVIVAGGDAVGFPTPARRERIAATVGGTFVLFGDTDGYDALVLE